MPDAIDLPAAELIAGATTVVAPAIDPAPDTPAHTGWLGEADGPMPMRGVALRTDRVPDLARIDRSLWRSVLARLGQRDRMDAAQAFGIAREAVPLALALPPAPSELAREALAEGPSLSMPEVQRAGHRPQVNVRLNAEEHEALRVAARLLGLTPTAVARVCIVTGVRRAIADHDAALERLRR